MSEAVRNPIFTSIRPLKSLEEQELVDYLKMFFHKQLFSTTVEVTNTNISVDPQKTDDEDMRRFVGMMFAMTLCSMSNIKDYWNVEDDGLMVASRFLEKLYMSHVGFAMIRKNRSIAPVPRGAKTVDAVDWFEHFNHPDKGTFAPSSLHCILCVCFILKLFMTRRSRSSLE
jgi:hypothetical protein